MSLAAGTRLGPYEVGAPIGTGGMGEVFRARDTKLDRDVAIKVLPEEFSQDKERAWPDASSCRLSSALSARDGLNLTAPSYLCRRVLKQHLMAEAPPERGDWRPACL